MGSTRQRSTAAPLERHSVPAQVVNVDLMLLAVHLSEAGLVGEMLELAAFNTAEVKLVGFTEEVEVRVIVEA